MVLLRSNVLRFLLLTLFSVSVSAAAILSATPVRAAAPDPSSTSRRSGGATTAIAQTTGERPETSGPLRTVRLAVGSIIVRGPIDIAVARGYFSKENIKIDLVNIAGIQEQLPHLATGELDASLGGVGAALFNAVARGIMVRIVGSCANSDTGHPTLTFLVRKDLLDSGQITKPADLKGRKIALSSLGSNAGTNLAALLKPGLTLADVEIVSLGYPEITTALANKSIDAGWSLEPFATLAAEKNIAAPWKDDQDLFPNKQGCILMYSTKFAQDRSSSVRFMRAFLKGVRDYNDAFYKNKGLDDVINLLVQTLPIKDGALYKKMRVPGINPNGQINLASLQADLDFFIEAGIVKAKIDLPKLIDGSFAETVVKELGAYK